MFKRYASYLIILLLGAGIGLAETGSQSLQEQFETIKQMNYLNQVGIYFFNETTRATPKDYAINIEQGKKKELNLLLKNESEKDLNVRVKFADQQLSNAGTIGCSTEYVDGFAKFVTASRKGDIIIPAKSQIKKTIQLEFPVGVEGIQKGCIAYGVTEDSEKNQRQVISIITRKVMYLDALIGGIGKIDYQIEKGAITKTINNKGELILSMKIKNTGNLDSQIRIEGKISNILGFERPIIVSGMILKGEEGIVTAKAVKLPSYGGLFTIKANIKDKPEFGFDATKFGVDPKTVAGGEEDIVTRYFKRHRWMIITLLILATILYMKLRKKKTVSTPI